MNCELKNCTICYHCLNLTITALSLHKILRETFQDKRLNTRLIYEVYEYIVDREDVI